MIDKDTIKADLLAIIKEAQNLPDEYLEAVPGTDIKVLKGKVREFRRLADDYYQLEFNQLVNEDTDTATPVYNLLMTEIQDEMHEYFASEAYQYIEAVTPEFERFKVLTKSLATVNKSYEMTARDLNSLLKKMGAGEDWQKKVDEKSAEVKRLGENAKILKEQLLLAKKNVNETLLSYVEKEMARIRDNMVKTSQNSVKSLSVDNKTFILETDKTEYDSLYLLSQMLKVANAKDTLNDFVVSDNFMIVTKDQEDALKAVLPNITLFGYIKNPSKVGPKDVNEKLLSRIREIAKTAQASMSKGKREAQDSSNLIIGNEDLGILITLLEKANASDEELFQVWGGAAYVKREDLPLFQQTIKKVPLLEDLNPDNKKKMDNKRLIVSLYDYLNTLADKATKHTGVANLPIKATKPIGDRAWIVVDSDLEEADRIVDIIKLLMEENKKDNLVGVWGIANVSFGAISKFKALANSTKFLGGRVPNIPENEAEMKKVHEALTNLIRKAKETPDGKMAPNGLVLENDLETYKLLENKYKILEAAKASDDLVPALGGVQVDSQYASKYAEIEKKLKEKLEPEKLSENDKELEMFEAGLAELNKKPSLDGKQQLVKRTYEALIDILKRAKTSANLVTVGDTKVDAQDEDVYKRLKSELEELLEPENTLANNEKEIANVKAEIQELEEKAKKSKRGKMAENGKVLQRDLKRYNQLLDKLKYLEEARTSNNLVSVNGVMIDKDHKDDYLKVDKKVNKKRKRILGVRKLLKKGKEFFKKHWMEVIALGLGIAITISILPGLVPSLIFSNSCVAAAAMNVPLAGPAVAGFFNTLSSGLAFFAGIPFAPGVGLVNVGASSSLAFSSAITSLAKLGLIGVTGLSIKKIKDLDKPNRLPDPERKNLIERLKSLGTDLRNGKDFSETNTETFNLEHSGTVSQTELTNAQMAYDVASSGRDLTEGEVKDFANTDVYEGVPVLDNLNTSFPEENLVEQIRVEDIAQSISVSTTGQPIEAENIETLDVMPPEDLSAQTRINDRARQLSGSGEPQEPPVVSQSSIPQVVVPSTDDIISQLGEQATEADAVAFRIGTLENQASEYQRLADSATEAEARDFYLWELDQANAEIAKLKGEGLAR